MSQIKSIGKKVVRRFVEPPWDSDLMEFQHGLWRGVSALFTESGRQLGEENARPFLFNDHVPAKTIICKYDGSRNGHPINMSALRIAMTNFDAALEITRAVIKHHARAAAATKPSKPAGIWDLYLIALASISLIACSVRKKTDQKTPAIVPDDLASQYQFIAGIFMICRHMIDTNCVQISENKPISAVELYDYADQHEIFESFNGMVCAGSTKKIMEFLEFCIDEMNGAFSGPNTLGDEAPSSRLGRIVDDTEQWYRYAIASIELDCFIKIARRKSKLNADTASATPDQEIIQIYQGISDCCHSLAPLSESTIDNAFESGSLIRQNAILSLLDKNPIKTIKKSHLAEQLGYD